MLSLSSDESPTLKKPSRASLWLILALCAAPVVASYVTFYFWQPSGHVNYGELLDPRPLPHAALLQPDGTPFDWRQVEGKWVLVVIGSAMCDAECRRDLVYTRQVRLAQGKDAPRIERVWLLTDDQPPAASLLAQHPGLRVLRVADRSFLDSFPARATRSGRIYVIDPLGNLMMRYPRNPDPRRMLKDVSRLLKHSQWQ